MGFCLWYLGVVANPLAFIVSLGKIYVNCMPGHEVRTSRWQIASGSRRSPNLGWHCQILIYNLLTAFMKLDLKKHPSKGV